MGIKLHQLKPSEGATHKKKRVGRGIGSGHGKTSGRGHKGQKSRRGYGELPAFFEGGQTPFIMRVPKRGFKNPNKKEYEIVNLKTLDRVFEANAEITPEVLKEKRLVHCTSAVKILGEGELTKPLNIKAHKFSKSAVEKIKAAGGNCEIIE
ncbi:MAG TPA: 50S ribosomal protein L15 [Persephonella sp.]|uniref:Large ribosomal subunit protein uL15 n=1 Tax=Persephonella marina (strain DSM 14350 / EX-H1) TaxID=123214 RepID=C0QQP2_PERMH|nr:ribosomal protein L15 [Persephonella marina EX-H1]HCB68739.1 50S ribosomal protein L15 [Persephonella sp.]